MRKTSNFGAIDILVVLSLRDRGNGTSGIEIAVNCKNGNTNIDHSISSIMLSYDYAVEQLNTNGTNVTNQWYRAHACSVRL